MYQIRNLNHAQFNYIANSIPQIKTNGITTMPIISNGTKQLALAIQLKDGNEITVTADNYHNWYNATKIISSGYRNYPHNPTIIGAIQKALK